VTKSEVVNLKLPEVLSFENYRTDISEVCDGAACSPVTQESGTINILGLGTRQQRSDTKPS
jgi:hypothetical protein